jgi:hypothetical protein
MKLRHRDTEESSRVPRRQPLGLNPRGWKRPHKACKHSGKQRDGLWGRRIRFGTTVGHVGKDKHVVLPPGGWHG